MGYGRLSFQRRSSCLLQGPLLSLGPGAGPLSYVTITATGSHGAQDVATVEIDVAEGCVPYFTDVALGSTFYDFIETAYHHDVISGYPCVGAGEQCDPQQRPYFRPTNTAIRGQVAKILRLALGSPPPDRGR